MIVPTVIPALLTGFALATGARDRLNTARWCSLGQPADEVGDCRALIIERLEQYDTAGATAIAVVMLLASFVLLFAINTIHWWHSRRVRGVA